eukprot:GEZU01021537.1.p1 GENE.GEZU01021537.1~~GEZU01021537.1.p1  ORF type:complete len:525 (+),score=81.88 GEZU01021537.1:302-1876(+)
MSSLLATRSKTRRPQCDHPSASSSKCPCSRAPACTSDSSRSMKRATTSRSNGSGTSPRRVPSSKESNCAHTSVSITCTPPTTLHSNTTTTTNNSSYVFNSKLMHDSFYRFMYVERPEELRDLLIQLCNRFELLGSIIVGHEGYNGMLAGKEANLDEFWSTLESSQHNEQYARLFSGLMKKRTVAITEEEAAAATAAGADIGNRIVLGTVFRRLKIKVKPEIVTLRQHVPYADKSHYATPDGTRITGIQVPPAKWRELINRPDVVLIDNRNDFEYKIGTFKGAINPGVNQFSDFAEFVRKHKEEWRGKKVAMFCTGGIRCEKASTWMLLNPEFKVRHPPTTTTADTTTSAAAAAETAATTEESTNATTRTKEEEEEDAIDGIYQLEGGILNYFAAMPDAHLDFEGECFVFDGRRTLDTRLQITRNEEALAKIDKFNLNDARLQKKQQEQQQHQEEREKCLIHDSIDYQPLYNSPENLQLTRMEYQKYQQALEGKLLQSKHLGIRQQTSQILITCLVRRLRKAPRE